jgi:DNA-binding response OmpR family regulator
MSTASNRSALERQLKASGSALPVIFMTALDDEATRDEALQAGCTAYLRKPFGARQLVDAIESAAPHLGQHRQSDHPDY